MPTSVQQVLDSFQALPEAGRQASSNHRFADRTPKDDV